jgi:hypothetical protein
VGSFVKVEGSAYTLIFLTVSVYAFVMLKDLPLRKKLSSLMAVGLPSLSIMVSFHLYKLFFTSLRFSGNEEKEQLTFTVKNLGLIPETIATYSHDLLVLSNWGIVWLIFLLSLPHLSRRWRSLEVQMLLLALTLFALLYIAAAIATPSYYWLVGPARMSTLARIFLHFFPLAILLIILVNYEPNFLGTGPSLEKTATNVPSSKRPLKKTKKK